MTTREEQLIRRYGAAADDGSGPCLADFSGLVTVQAARSLMLVKRLANDSAVAILGDPVGTGKTVIALTAAARLLEQGKVDQVVVVAPNRVVRDIWEARAEHFGPVFRSGRLSVLTAGQVHGHPRSRRTKTLVIVDEAHRRLHRGAVADYMRSGPQGRSHRRLLLSATPFQTSVSELAELVALGDREGRTKQISDALEQYGSTVTRVARTASAQLDVYARRDLQKAAREWGAASRDVLMPPLTAEEERSIGLSAPLLPPAQIVPLPAGRWTEAFHVARITPEITQVEQDRPVRPTDSFQRGLSSSVEAFWASAAAGGLRHRRFSELRTVLEKQLGTGSDHPKVAHTVEWVRDRVREKSHVAIFCVWTATAEALRCAVAERLEAEGLEADVIRPPGDSVSAAVTKQFRDKEASPLVLILQERFSESIDLDRGEPALIHYDLPWNPARLRQRWGRFVRASSGFTPIPPDRILIPVLDHESDRRVCDTVMKRAAIGDVLLADKLALHDTKDSELNVADWVLESLRTG